MELLNQPAGATSPLQKHSVMIANDVFWISGELNTMGNPHHYINQDGLDFLHIEAPHLAPWTFTSLPSSHPPEVILGRERMQLLVFTGEDALSQFQTPIKTHPLILYLPLAVVHGEAPFLSEAQVHNFLDFWRGIFFPIVNASIHYLVEGMIDLPTQVPVLYANRTMLLQYIEG